MNQKETPMMVQWRQLKEKSKGAVLLFRMGDFYEAFHEDASIVAESLNLTLTKRQEIPMSGVPVHAAENYIDKLVRQGHHVAIAEQVEDPKMAKGLVKRDLVRILSPGTVVSSSIVEPHVNNFFACMTQVSKRYGLAFVDVSCSLFKAVEFATLAELQQELLRLEPSELLASDKFCSQQSSLIQQVEDSLEIKVTSPDASHYHPETANNRLLRHFGVETLDGFGLSDQPAASIAASVILAHLEERHLLDLSSLTSLSLYRTANHLNIDPASMRHLELFSSATAGGSLISIIDKTKTAMGARTLREWLKRPLLEVIPIEERQEAIKQLTKRYTALGEAQQIFESMSDLERVITRCSLGYVMPRDLLDIAKTLSSIEPLKETLEEAANRSNLLLDLIQQMNPLKELQEKIFKTLTNPPPAKLGSGGAVNRGVSQELDELKEIATNSKEYLVDYASKLKSQTGIKTLKISFNRMFGYYIEVSHAASHLVPETFQRRQTLVNAERYITDELKDFESKVLRAEERIIELEREIFDKLLSEVLPYKTTLLKTAQAIAAIDALSSLSIVALTNGWHCPKVDSGSKLEIEEGRHPVVEALLKSGPFIPNDTTLNDQEQRLYLITGPNMAGKSTYIRQVALIVILSQIGSFVPAKCAKIGLIDQLFTRIGASDDLARGQSTFMVEMAETANILNNATNRSLVILDEIGRGTSTYDGISIAWAVAEYLLTTPGKRAKTLFATHYWELTKLEEEIEGAKNFHSAVKESSQGIHFLRKILPGGTDKSYGIHVAKLAGLPTEALMRAEEILTHLEENANREHLFKAPKRAQRRSRKVDDKTQLMLFK